MMRAMSAALLARFLLALEVFFLQGGQHHGIDEGAHVAAHHGDFPHQGSGDGLVAVVGDDEVGVDGGLQDAVEAGHAAFVVEVAGITQAAHDEVGADVASEVGDKPGEGHDAHVGQPHQDGLGHVDALGHGEQGVGAAVGDGDDDGFVMGGNAVHDVLVAQGQRVEGSGVDDEGHGSEVSS